MDQSCSGWGKLTGSCESANENSGSIKWGNVLTGCKQVSFSRRTVLH